MTKAFNDIFRQLLIEYNLPQDLSFTIDIPTEVQEILNDDILMTDFGVTLKSFNNLYKTTNKLENQSIVEDNENHFHVDWCFNPTDNKKAFMLGVKTLVLLADKFQKQNITGIRFWYSFQTPELGLQWAEANNLNQDNDEHLLSDRLSFFTRRDGEEIISINEFEKSFSAILTIDT